MILLIMSMRWIKLLAPSNKLFIIIGERFFSLTNYLLEENMGWFGYGIYDGDETQSRHFDYIKWFGIEKDEEVICEEYMTNTKTIIPDDKKKLLQTNFAKFIKKMIKVPRFWNEDNAIEWHMLLALYLDNKVQPPMMVYDVGIEATEYLIEEHAYEYDNPAARRRVLRNFIKKAKKLGYYKK